MTSIDSLVNLETFKKNFFERKAQEDFKKVLSGTLPQKQKSWSSFACSFVVVLLYGSNVTFLNDIWLFYLLCSFSNVYYMLSNF